MSLDTHSLRTQDILTRLAAAFVVLSTLACGPPRDVTITSSKRPVSRVTEGTRVSVIGSGTPVADPARGGPATAVRIEDHVLLFDAGAGVLRGLVSAHIAPGEVEHVFVTHLHSDHTLGLDELIFGAWTVGREVPLHVHGPPGIDAMVTHLRAAFAEDRALRVEGLEDSDARGAEVSVHVVGEGAVHEQDDVTVSAFRVEHGSWEHAFGYRVESPDRVVVISGDTAPSDAVVDACDGCDVLVHEVYSAAGWREGAEGFRAYHAAFHTSGEQLGELAVRARPRLLVLNHLLFFGRPPEELLREVRASFDGEVVIAEDGAEY